MASSVVAATFYSRGGSGAGEGGRVVGREMRVRSGPGPVGAALSSDLDARAARVGRCPAAAHQVSLSPARAASARVPPRSGLPRERSDGRGAVSW